MKNKFRLSWIIIVVLMASVMQPPSALAEGTDGKTFKSSIMDKDTVIQYKRELGELNTVVKTVCLPPSQSSSINKFDLEWKAGSIYIIPTNSSTIKITQKGYHNQSKSEQRTYASEKGTLKIRDNRKNIEMFSLKINDMRMTVPPNATANLYMYKNNASNNEQKKLDEYRKKMLYDVIIEVPQRQYEKIIFRSSYASCIVKDMKINEVESESTSGIVQLNKCILKYISSETVNGSVNLINCSVNNVRLSAVNGVLWVDNSEVTDLRLDVIN